MKIYLLLVLCELIWAGNFIVGRYIRFELDPIELTFFRWLLVSILFIPQFIKHRHEIYENFKKHFFYIVAVSSLGISFFNAILYYGLQNTYATNALIISSTTPLIIILFSRIILKIHLSKMQLFGVILSMLGVIYLALSGKIANILTLQFNKGDLIIIVSSLMWGLYSVMLKCKPQDIKAFFETVVFCGMLILLVIFVVTNHHIQVIFTLKQNALFAIFYTGVFASIVGYLLWSKGVEAIGTNKTGHFTHLLPVFGIILAYLFLGEKLQMYHIYGFSIIAMGLSLSLFIKKPKMMKI